MTGSGNLRTERLSDRVIVIIEGETIADTTSAVKVSKDGLEPEIYIPKNDIREIDLIKCGDRETSIGHAEIYTIRHGARDIEDAAWSYDDPDQSHSELQGRVAFSTEKVQEIRISE